MTGTGGWVEELCQENLRQVKSYAKTFTQDNDSLIKNWVPSLASTKNFSSLVIGIRTHKTSQYNKILKLYPFGNERHDFCTFDSLPKSSERELNYEFQIHSDASRVHTMNTSTELNNRKTSRIESETRKYDSFFFGSIPKSSEYKVVPWWATSFESEFNYEIPNPLRCKPSSHDDIIGRVRVPRFTGTGWESGAGGWIQAWNKEVE